MKSKLMSTITSAMTSIKNEYASNPVSWKNDETPLNETNLNSLTNSIRDTRDKLNSIHENHKIVLEKFVDANAGWIVADGDNPTTCEIFNDYDNNIAISEYSHAEGNNTSATSPSSHAEGHNTHAGVSDDENTEHAYAHAEGDSTIAGWRSHSEGYNTFANNTSHAEGRLTKALGKGSHAEGSDAFYDIYIDDNTRLVTATNTNIEDDYVAVRVSIDDLANLGVIQGNHISVYPDTGANFICTDSKRIVALVPDDDSDDVKTLIYVDSPFKAINYLEDKNAPEDGIIPLGTPIKLASGSTAAETASHAEGRDTKALAACSHSEGDRTISQGFGSHSEGILTKAIGKGSHAEGCCDSGEWEPTAEGIASHVEGGARLSKGHYSHAEGIGTTSEGRASHSEGNNTKAIGENSHAEGRDTKAHAINSHAEGQGTEAKCRASHSEGIGTIANGDAQHVQGKYNIEDTENKYVHIVGNGTNGSNRSDAYRLDWQGNGWFAGKITCGVESVSDNEDLVPYGQTSMMIDGCLAEAKAYTDTEISGLINGAPDALNTLNELAAALGNDKNYAATITNELTTIKNNMIGRRAAGTGAEIFNFYGDGTKSNYSFSNYSHAEGYCTGAGAIWKTDANGNFVDADGNIVSSKDKCVIITAGGGNNGRAAHAEGQNTLATGSYSHSEGIYTRAVGAASHAEGRETVAEGDNEHVQGKYNLLATQTGGKDIKGRHFAHVIGNGSSEADRKNAHTIDWDGNAWFAGDVTVTINSESISIASLLERIRKLEENPVIHSGTTYPTSDDGDDGDIYVQYSTQ